MPTDESTVVLQPGPSAVGDGYVEMLVLKAAAWPTVVHNYSKVNLGPTMAPYGSLVVRIPVEGVQAGQPLTVAQMAVIFEQALQMSLPACGVFIAAVEDDFGYEPAQEEDDGSF